MSHEQIRNGLDLLVSIEPTDVPFLSVYLDLQKGGSAALRQLYMLQRDLGNKLSSSQKTDFDEAVRMTRELLVGMPKDCRSVAIFARGILGGQFLQALPLAVEVENRLAFSHRPDVMPLTRLLQEQGHYLVATLASGWMQVTENDFGMLEEKSWITLPRRVESDQFSYRVKLDDRQSSAVPRALPSQITRLRQLMEQHEQAYMVLNCNAITAEQVIAGLPMSLRNRLVTMPGLVESRDPQIVDEQARNALHLHLESNSMIEADRVLAGITQSGEAVVGANACLDALQSNNASSLVIVEGVELQDNPSKVRNPYLEVLRLALLAELPVHFLPADHELMELGGVGCMTGLGTLSRQASIKPQNLKLDLVA